MPNVGQVQSFLEGRTTDAVRVIGVEPAPMLHLRSGNEALAAATVQGTLWMAVAADMWTSLVVIFNGMRLLRTGAQSPPAGSA